MWYLGLIVAGPLVLVTLPAVVLAARRNRVAFVINIVIGVIGVAAIVPLLLVAAGIVGLVVTTDGRRHERIIERGARFTGAPGRGRPPTVGGTTSPPSS